MQNLKNLESLRMEKRMNTLEFLGYVYRLDEEYRKAKKALDENAQKIGQEKGTDSPEFIDAYDAYVDLKYPLSQVECKVARAINDASQAGFEDLVLVEEFNTIWDREIVEFSKILRDLGCKKILWANNSSGLIDTLKELSNVGWAFSGFAEVKGKSVLVLVSE